MLARRALLGAALALPALPALLAPASASPRAMGLLAKGGFDRASFDLWVRARAGTGAPVWWCSEGTVRSLPSGELIAYMEGFDTARVHRPDPAMPLAHQYNRKIYVFRDAATGEVIRERAGRAVQPIAYEYQFITYALKGDRVETVVEQGRAPNLRRIGPGDDMAVRMQGDTAIFTAPVYLDVPVPGTERRMQAFENYDFVVDRNAPPSSYVLSWLRTGALPPGLGGQQGVMHLVTRRVDRWQDVPASMRGYVETDAPLWREPPRDLADIRRLQRA